jgi:hypothetical protein
MTEIISNKTQNFSTTQQINLEDLEINVGTNWYPLAETKSPLIKKCSAFSVTKSSLSLHDSHTLHCIKPDKYSSHLHHQISLRFISILFFHLCLGFPCGLLQSVSMTKFFWHFSTLPKCLSLPFCCSHIVSSLPQKTVYLFHQLNNYRIKPMNWLLYSLLTVSLSSNNYYFILGNE